jgi:HEAT repeat protein
MGHIFISYHRAEADFATVLRLELEKAGHTVWIDDHAISPGADWRSEIDQGIQTATALIAVMTPEAARSEYVTYEWAFALGRGILVIPVVLRAATLHPRLDALQYLDFSTHDARPWSRLLEIIEQPNVTPPGRAEDLKAPSVIDKAIGALESLDPEERRLALEVLGQSSDPTAQHAVRTALRHSILDVRVMAAISIAPVDPSAALPALVEGLAFNIHGDEGTRRLFFEVKDTLRDIGQGAVPFLVQALTSPNETVWSNAARVLGEIGDDSAVPALLSRLAKGRKGRFLDGRNVVVEALGEIGSATALEALMEFVADRRENEYTVRDAIWALGRIGSAEATPFLLEQLPRQSRKNQTLIIVVLGMLGDDRAVPALAEFLTDTQPADDGLSKVSTKPMREHAADALRKIGSPSALAALNR